MSIVLCLLLIGCTSTGDHSLSTTAQVAQLQEYLTAHYQTPEDYVISKFTDHDIVFLGERHRLKHDVALVRSLIPRLHEIGIYDLGIEFARFVDQPRIDSLITADVYDEALARQLEFDQWPWWGFQDYIDIYKAAWETNQNRPEGTPPFRVIGLGARSDFSYWQTPEDRENRELNEKVWPDGDGDEYMAAVAIHEILDAGHKALIYSGCNHGYTRYKQTVYDLEKDTLVRLIDDRMGNLVFAKAGDRCFNIFLHSPWPSQNGWEHSVLPADGLVDSLIARLPDTLQRAGFDVIGTAFGDLPGANSYWKYGYPDFKLADFCDGYIIQGPMTSYEGVSVAKGFFDEHNRLAAIAQIANPDPQVKDTSRTVDNLMGSLTNDTKIQEIFEQSIIDYDKLRH
jgi:hypothetical protein